MMRRSQTWCRGAGVALLGLALVAAAPAANAGWSSLWWNEDDDGDDRRMARPAMVRLLHAAPAAPAVDVWVDGERVATGLAYGNATGYARLPSGERMVEVTLANTTEPVVVSADLDLEASRSYTALVIGPLDNLTALVLEDNTRPRGSSAHVRFVHASPDAPAVDVALDDGGAVVFGDTAYGEATDYTSLRRGTYDLEVRLAGEDTVALDLPPVRLPGGGAFTVYALGMAEDGTLRAAITADMTR